MKVVFIFILWYLKFNDFPFRKKFTGVDDFAKSMIKGEFFMGDPRAIDEAWQKAAQEKQYDNLLMLKFEDILGKIFAASLADRYIIVNSR